MWKRASFKQSGFSLVEVLVAVGIVGILIATALSLSNLFLSIESQQKSAKARLDLQTQAQSVLSDVNVCGCNLNNLKFPPNSTALNLQQLQFWDYTCKTAGATIAQVGSAVAGSSITIQAIQIKNILALNANNQYRGDVEIDFKSSGVALAPLKLVDGVHFQVDITKNVVSACLPAGSSGVGAGFAGLTTATYDGDLGGYGGANAKCQAQYPGSHLCTESELVKTGATSIGMGWIQPESPTLPSLGGGSSFNCADWTINNGSDSGRISTSVRPGSEVTLLSCASKLPLVCCQ